MSHGGGGGDDDSAEPNLTAMLDVVMQLLMYFIMCVNFIDQENNVDLVLPVAQTALPRTAGRDQITVNIRQDNEVVPPLTGEGAMDRSALLLWADNQALIGKARYPDRWADHLDVVMRAGEDVSYSWVYEVMQIFKDKGFKRFKMIAVVGHESEGG